MYKKILMGMALAIAMPLSMSAQAEFVITHQIGFETADTYNEAGFDRDGVHQQTQTTEDPEGYTAAGNQAPVINSFSASPASGDAPLAVTFSANVSDDVGTPSLNINYGDGSSGSSLSHTYNDAGDYTATLTATDEKGLAVSATTAISAADAGPECRNHVYNNGDSYWYLNYATAGWDSPRIIWDGVLIANVYTYTTSYTKNGYTYTRTGVNGNSRYEICRQAN